MTARAYEEPLLRFFSFIFDPMPPTHKIEIRTINPPSTGQVWMSSPPLAASIIISMASYNVYFGVLPREKGHGDRAHVYPVGNILWADLDNKTGSTFHDLLESPLPEPCAVVASGHGWHAYWKLRAPAPHVTIEALNGNIAKVLGSDNVGDVARVMRVPYTLNVKPGQLEVMATIMKLDADCEGHHAGSFMLTPELSDATFRKRARAVKRLDRATPHNSRSEELFARTIGYILRGPTPTDLDELETFLLATPAGEKLYEMSPGRRRKWIELTYKNAKRALSRRRETWMP